MLITQIASMGKAQNAQKQLRSDQIYKLEMQEMEKERKMHTQHIKQKMDCLLREEREMVRRKEKIRIVRMREQMQKERESQQKEELIRIKERARSQEIANRLKQFQNNQNIYKKNIKFDYEKQKTADAIPEHPSPKKFDFTKNRLTVPTEKKAVKAFISPLAQISTKNCIVISDQRRSRSAAMLKIGNSLGFNQNIGPGGTAPGPSAISKSTLDEIQRFKQAKEEEVDHVIQTSNSKYIDKFYKSEIACNNFSKKEVDVNILKNSIQEQAFKLDETNYLIKTRKEKLMQLKGMLAESERLAVISNGSLIKKLGGLERELEKEEHKNTLLTIQSRSYLHLHDRIRKENQQKKVPFQEMKAECVNMEKAITRTKKQEETDYLSAISNENKLISNYKELESRDKFVKNDINYAKNAVYFKTLLEKYLSFKKAQKQFKSSKTTQKKSKRISEVKEEYEEAVDDCVNSEAKLRGMEDILNEVRKKTKQVTISNIPNEYGYLMHIKEALQRNISALSSQIEGSKETLKGLEKEKNDIYLYNYNEHKSAQLRKTIENKLENEEYQADKILKKLEKKEIVLHNMLNTISRLATQLNLPMKNNIYETNADNCLNIISKRIYAKNEKIEVFLKKEEKDLLELNESESSKSKTEISASLSPSQIHTDSEFKLPQESPREVKNQVLTQISENETLKENGEEDNECDFDPKEIHQYFQYKRFSEFEFDELKYYQELKQTSPKTKMGLDVAPEFLGLRKNKIFHGNLIKISYDNKDLNDEKLLNKVRSLFKHHKLGKLDNLGTRILVLRVLERTKIIGQILADDNKSKYSQPLKLSAKLKAKTGTFRNLGIIRKQGRDRLTHLRKGLLKNNLFKSE